MTARLTDLRITGSTLVVKGIYALLYDRRDELDAALAHATPEAVLAAAIGCPLAEAPGHLAALRAAGLVGDGLTLLAGASRRRRGRVAPAEAGANQEVRTKFAAELDAGWSYRAAARAVGCSDTALRAFAAGKKDLGAELLASLGRELTVRTKGANQPANQGCEPVGSQQVRTPSAPSSPLASLPLSPSLSPSDSPSEPSNTPTTPDSARAGAGEGEQEPQQDRQRQAQEPPPAPKAKREPKAKPAPRPDPVPMPGTLARKVYDAVTTDGVLGPITAGPGEFAERVSADGAYPGVDVLAEVQRAGEWLSGKPSGYRSDGRAFLRNWLRGKADDFARSPKPMSNAPARPGFAAAAPRGRAPLATREEFEREAREPMDVSIYGRTGS